MLHFAAPLRFGRVVALLCLFGFYSCTVFTENPFREKELDSELFGLIGTDAKHRAVLVVTREGCGPHPGEKLKSVRFASEPPPDAMEDITSALRATVELAVKDGQGSAEISKNISTASALLAARSQGVGLFRDGSFRLAEAYANGAIRDTEYVELYRMLVNSCAALVSEEIDAGLLGADVVARFRNDPAANDPAANDPAANDPAANDPAANDPDANDPDANDPAANDPAAIDPAAIDPAAIDPAAIDPAASR